MNFTMTDSGPKKKVYVDTNPFGIMALDERQQEACTMSDVINDPLSKSTDIVPTVETLDMPITTFNQASLTPNLLNQQNHTQSKNLTLPSMPNHRPRKLSNTLDPGITSSRNSSCSAKSRPELLVNTARGPISSSPSIPTASRTPIPSSSSSSHVKIQSQQTSSEISSLPVSSAPKPQVFDKGSYAFQIPDIVRDSFARAQLDNEHFLSPTVESMSPTNSLNDLIDEYSIPHTPNTDIHKNGHELTTPLELQSRNSSVRTFVPQSAAEPPSQSFSQNGSPYVPYRVLPSQSDLYPASTSVSLSAPPSVPPSAPPSAPSSIPPSVPPSVPSYISQSVPPSVPASVHSSIHSSVHSSVSSSVSSSGSPSIPPSLPPSVPSSPYLRRSSDSYHVARSLSHTSPIMDTSTFNANHSAFFVPSPKMHTHDNYNQNYSTPTVTLDASLPPPLPPKPPKMLSRLDIPASQLLESLSRRRSSVSSVTASVSSTIHDQSINDPVVEEGEESQVIESEQLVPMDPPSNSYDIPANVNVGDQLNRLRQEQQRRVQEEQPRQPGSGESELSSSDTIPEYVTISAEDYGSNFDNESHLTLTTPTTTNSNVSMESNQSNQSSQSLHTTTTSIDNVTSTQESLSLVREITEEEFLASLPAPPDYTNKASPGEISVPNRMAIDPITINDNPPKEDPPEYTEVSAELAPLILRPQFSQTGGNRRSSRGSRSGSNTNSSSNVSTNTSSRTHTRPSIYPASRHSNRTHELNAPPLLPNRPPALPGNRHAASESYNRSPRQPPRVVRSLIPLEIQESNLPVGGSTIYDGSRRSSNSSVHRQGSSTSVNSRTRR